MRFGITALGLAAAMLVGCNQDTSENLPQPFTEAERHAIVNEMAAKAEQRAAVKAATTYRDPREGLKPNPNLCGVPPCGHTEEAGDTQSESDPDPS